MPQVSLLRPATAALLLLGAGLIPSPAIRAQESSVRLPAAKRLTLPNGMRVIIVEQHEVPVVSFQFTIRAGSVLDPPGKEGLASLTAQLLRRGTARRSPEKIAEEIDFVGGTLAIAVEPDFAVGHAEFLRKDITIGLEILSDVLRNPTFTLKEVLKLEDQEVDAVLQEKDAPEVAIEHFFDAFLFGKHPYARPSEGDEQSITTINRADIARFYNAYYVPSAVTLVIAGDITGDEVEKLVTEKFGSWKARSYPRSMKLDSPARVRGRKLLLVDKPDATQTFFLIGNVGVERTNPDRVGLAVVNTVFGGRFTSMLNEALRVNSGLTYGAESDFAMMRVAGPFSISSYTRNSTTGQAIDLALEVLRNLHSTGLTESQLVSAKNYLKGQFPLQLETSSQIARTFAELDAYGLDENEINGYFSRIDQLTLGEARRIISAYYPLDDLVFVIIGKASEIRPQLRKYAARIDERQLSDPGFK
jgi:predicted Zn-dependent peptidase